MIKGAPGPDGQPGERGDTGASGNQGEKGSTILFQNFNHNENTNLFQVQLV